MTRLVLVLALAVLLALPAAHAAQFHLDWPSVQQWLCADPKTCLNNKAPAFPELRRSVIQRTSSYLAQLLRSAALHEAPQDVFGAMLTRDATVRRLATLALKRRGLDATSAELLHEFVALWRDAGNVSYPYFGFLPSYLGKVLVGSPATTISSPCFPTIGAKAELTPQSTVNISLQFGAPSGQCSDLLLVVAGGTGDIAIHQATTSGVQTFEFTSTADVLTRWYLQNQGIHVFKFTSSNIVDIVGNIGATVILLTGYFESPLSQVSADASYEFMRTYTQASARMQPLFTPRSSGSAVALGLPSDYIQSGDAFTVIRLDGLDPMIGWGEGDTAGHSVIAMRDSSNVLHVCESTTLDAYWPTNGVQCHTYAEWVTMATAAQYNVVHLPLSPAARAMFNATAAWNFYNANAGFNYGYEVFLFGWLDLPDENLPCLPPDFSTTCFNRMFLQDVALYIDMLQADGPTNMIRQALNHRLNTSGLTVMDLLRVGVQQLQISDLSGLYTLPEQDSWLYNTTRYGQPAVGKSMVCDVFVCNMWKAGGIFAPIGNNIQCGEQDLWDIFSMKIYDSAKTGSGRPAICQQYDPANPLCQLMGPVYFTYNPDFNTRTLYPNMGEHCSSMTPDYIRQPGC